MKRSASAICFLLMAFTFKSAFAASLWQGTTSGMAPLEVKKLFPAATAPRHFEGNEVMSLSGITIFGQKFGVVFCFGSQGLTKVSLLASNMGKRDDFTRNPDVTFHLILDELIRKYGQPINKKSSAFGGEVQFLNNGTSVDLSYMDFGAIGDKTRSITVTYDSNSPGGENPL